MLNVTEELKNILKNDYFPRADELAPKDLIISFPTLGLTIETDQIVDDSFALDEKLCSEEDLVFGSCEASQIKFTVADVDQDLKGLWFTISQVVNGATIPLGTYKVYSCKKQGNLRFKDIIAYDALKDTDVDVSDWYRGLTFPLTLKQFRASLLAYLGIEESTSDFRLTNDDMIVERTIDPGQLSGRAVLQACEEINGVFGHIGRDGKFKHIVLQPGYGLYPSETLYPSDDLFPVDENDTSYVHESIIDETIGRPMYKEVKFEEYTVKEIDKLIIRAEEDDIGAIVGGDQRRVIDTQVGTSIQSTKSDDSVVEIQKIEGATTVTPANPDLDISPDNVATITSAKDFELVSCGKNLLKNNATTQTFNGITFIINEYGSVTVNGTVTTGTNSRILLNDRVQLPIGKYRVNGVPVGNYGGTSICAIKNSTEGAYTIVAKSGADLEFEVTDEKDYYAFFIRIAFGYTFNNYKFHPMIRPSTIVNSTFEPYKSNKLTITKELNKLPNGVADTRERINDKYVKYTQRIRKTTRTTTGSITDAKTNGQYICSVAPSGFLNGTTFTMPSGATSAEILYELATPIEEIVEEPSTLTSYKGITNITTNANPQVSLTADFCVNPINTYVIEGNFLVFGKSASELETIAHNAFGNMAKRPYRPYQAESIGLPYIEVGDTIEIATDEPVTGYVLQRTLTGIQALRDEYTAEGNEKREQNFGLNTEIIQLQGRYNKIKKDVDEVSVNLTDLAQNVDTSFEITHGEIALKVDKAGVIGAINLSNEEAKISASKINLYGYVTVNDLAGEGSTIINGSNITTGTIDASVVNVINLNADNITSGTIVADSVKSNWVYAGNISASQINAGTISGDRINGGTITGASINSVFYNGSDTITIGMSGIGFGIDVDASGVSANADLFHNGLTFSVNGITRATYGKDSVSIGSGFSADRYGAVSCNSLSVNGYSAITSYNIESYIPTVPQYTNQLIASDTGYGNIDFQGFDNAAGVNWVQANFAPKTSSDVRLKHDISSLDSIPNELFMSLKPKQFRFKTDKNGKGICFGLIAQELENAFSSFGLNPYDYDIIELDDVRKYTDDGMYVDGETHRINYINFIPWMVKIIQEQNDKIISLEDTVQEQNERISTLEEKLYNY